MHKDEVADLLVAYGESFGAPVLEGQRVTGIERNGDGRTFHIRTDDGSFEAAQVVLATGALQAPRIPKCAADTPRHVMQFVAPAYRNPRQLPPGAVLIVGSGESGCQIAEELVRAGRQVYLCVGKSWWLPRRYRGRDIAFWLRSLAWFATTVDDLPLGTRTGPPNPQLTGGGRGHDINAYTLQREGVVLLGRLLGISDGTLKLGSDLSENIAWGDDQARQCLRTIDAYIVEQAMDVPEEWPRDLADDRSPIPDSPSNITLATAGISTVIWATGYRPDLGWVGLPFLDPDGYPIQRRGVTNIPGLYILGLDWLYSAGSGIFPGLAEDAAYLATSMAAHSA
jgi:putative flavoprotein involved in K+ transport